MFKGVKILIGVVLIFMLGVVVGMSFNERLLILRGEIASVADDERGTATLMVDFGEDVIMGYSGEVVFGETLFDFFGRVAKENEINFVYEEYSGLGVLVNQVGDKFNGDGGKYWQYWVNGEYGKVGVDSYIIRVGDVVLWKFAGSQF